MAREMPPIDPMVKELYKFKVPAVAPFPASLPKIPPESALSTTPVVKQLDIVTVPPTFAAKEPVIKPFSLLPRLQGPVVKHLVIVKLPYTQAAFFPTIPPLASCVTGPLLEHSEIVLVQPLLKYSCPTHPPADFNDAPAVPLTLIFSTVQLLYPAALVPFLTNPG